MRLNRFLASAGLGSRRSCEELIRTGQVTINGVVCENLATSVEPSDVVKVGQRVLHSAAPMTILINKPPGYLCTASDTHDRQTVFDLLPPHFPRLFHVGRLDRESEGLLILTNDGELSLKLTHPRYKVSKEYEVVLDHPFDYHHTEKLLHGMSLEEGWAKAESVHKLAANKIKVVLRQGLKRQIRRMFYTLGYEVKKLVRVRIGPLTIGNLPPGSWRNLAQKEIDALLAEGAKTAAEAPETPHIRKPRPAFRNPERPQPRSERGEWSDAPRRSPARPAGARPGKGHGPSRPVRRGEAEEIPFVPRARRTAEAEGESPRRPRSQRPFGAPSRTHGDEKPFGKPWLKSQKPKGKPAAGASAKPKPHAFAKFDKRRRFEEY